MADAAAQPSLKYPMADGIDVRRANSAHAATISSFLGEQLSYAALEPKLVALAHIVRICDEHLFAFVKFDALEEPIFKRAELEDEHEERGLDPSEGLDAPLEGELVVTSCIMDVSREDDARATAIHCAAAKYCVLTAR